MHTKLIMQMFWLHPMHINLNFIDRKQFGLFHRTNLLKLKQKYKIPIGSHKKDQSGNILHLLPFSILHRIEREKGNNEVDSMGACRKFADEVHSSIQSLNHVLIHQKWKVQRCFLSLP